MLQPFSVPTLSLSFWMHLPLHFTPFTPLQYFRMLWMTFWNFLVVLQPFSVRTLSSLGAGAELLPQATEINGESMNNHWKTREKSMILRDLQNLDFCDTSGVKTWFGMYLDDKKSMESHENLSENQFSKKLRKHIVKLFKNTSKRDLNHLKIDKMASKAAPWGPRRAKSAPRTTPSEPKVDLETSKRCARDAQEAPGSIYSCFIMISGDPNHPAECGADP